MNTISKMIAERREELNLTLEDVGKYVGVGASTVRKWETGMIKNMRRDKIALLSKVLQLPPYMFIDKEPTDQLDLDLVDLIMSLPPEKKEEAIRYIRYLSSVPE